ncbi:MAG: nitroreductase [Oscillospiraceae bacterium]|nr:nitroreductase [Oscillospiraceae bacterium]
MDNQVFETIRTRRSTRSYKKEVPDKVQLDMVLEAGRYAPSGGNSQSARFFCITNTIVLDDLAEIVLKSFAEMEETPGMYRSKVSSIRRAKTGNYRYDYHAPVLVVAVNDRDYGNSMADCSCALENMMIMANALDLGTCWINQLHWLTEDEALLKYLKTLGLKDNERVFASLAVGYPETESGLPVREPLPRTGNAIVNID